jgi:magnesium chelatase subunit I
VAWFDEGGAIKVGGDERADVLVRGFTGIAGLLDVVQQTGLAPLGDPARVVAACELVLEGLVAQKRISRSDELGYARARRERPPGGGGAGLGGQNLFQ